MLLLGGGSCTAEVAVTFEAVRGYWHLFIDGSTDLHTAILKAGRGHSQSCTWDCRSHVLVILESTGGCSKSCAWDCLVCMQVDAGGPITNACIQLGVTAFFGP